jgi:tetratricopeptide (TPR) repeat protein
MTDGPATPPRPGADDPARADASPAGALAGYRDNAEAARQRFIALPSQAIRHSPFGTSGAARDWFESERVTLVQAVADAAGDPARGADAVRIALALAEFLDRSFYIDDWVTTATSASATAAVLGDERLQAAALVNLGAALTEARRVEEAIRALEQAGSISARIRDRHGEVKAYTRLGSALNRARRDNEAIQAEQRALALCTELGDRREEARAWNTLGAALLGQERFEEALTAFQRARDICRELGDRHGEAKAWNNLGGARQGLGSFKEALTAHQRARDIYRDVGDRRREATASHNLGTTLYQVRRFEEAVSAHQQARDISRELGDRRMEATAWNNLGGALRELRRFEEAVTAFQRALDLSREVGDQHVQAGACKNLGVALREVRRFEEAITAHRRALVLYGDLGERDKARSTQKSLDRTVRAAKAGASTKLVSVARRRWSTSAAPGPKKPPPRPVESDLLERFREAHAGLTHLQDEWFAFESSTEDVFLRRPLLNDLHEPLTAAFRHAWADATDTAQVWPVNGMLPGISELERFEHLVNAAWDSWRDANRHAVEVGLGNFHSEERALLRRACKLIAQMNDAATTPAYRDNLLDSVLRLLAKLQTIYIPVADLLKLDDLECVRPRLEIAARPTS